MASSDNDEDYYYAGDDNEDYYCTDFDEGCQSASESDVGGSDNDYVDDGHEMDLAVDKNEDTSEREATYVLEIEDDVRKRQDDAMAATAELLSVPPGFAAALLRHCQWEAEQLEAEWFSDERRIRDAVGLPVDVAVPTALNNRRRTCGICFDDYPRGGMRSAGCSHYYCHECWRGYIRAAVGDGPRCLSLRCPEPRCSVAVVRELVDEVADDEEKERYAMFALRSFVEEGKNRYVRWCPGAGCTMAVRSKIGLQLYEVSCACKHAFCFRCGEEAHRPASCETTREWVAKNSSEGETMKWVLANTKNCPKCRRAIEKNEGCMHMTCMAPCRHEFCWLCLGPWSEHTDNYNCNRYDEGKAAGEFSEVESRRRQAKASLERYLHYYERWTAIGQSRKKAREDLDGLVEGDGLQELADALGVPLTELGFVKEAYEQIIESRRVLRWTYAYVYYLDPKRDKVKRNVCEYIQGEAEQALERLHCCAEQERKGLREAAAYGAGAASAAEMLRTYRIKLVTLSVVMRNHFNNLVKDFEAGMADLAA